MPIWLTFLKVVEAAGSEDSITESATWEGLKLVSPDKTPRFVGRPYELDLRQSPAFVPLVGPKRGGWNS